MDRGNFRLLFCLVVAVCAATLADPLVEFASNGGWFGAGSFTDHSNLDVVPALVATLSLALFYVFRRARLIVTPRTFAFERRLRDSLYAGLSSKPLAKLLPGIFVGQLAVLYGMETLEQIAVVGHPLGGAIWLGAPIAIALGCHALACVLTAYALARILSGLTRIAVDVVLFIRTIALRQLPSRPVCPTANSALQFARPSPLASRGGLRAPPSLLA